MVKVKGIRTGRPTNAAFLTKTKNPAWHRPKECVINREMLSPRTRCKSPFEYA